jgi:hypothetical protein
MPSRLSYQYIYSIYMFPVLSLLQYNSLVVPLFLPPYSIALSKPVHLQIGPAMRTQKFSYLSFTFSHVCSFPWEASASSPLATSPTLAAAVTHRSQAHGDSPSIPFETGHPVSQSPPPPLLSMAQRWCLRAWCAPAQDDDGDDSPLTEL